MSCVMHRILVDVGRQTACNKRAKREDAAMGARIMMQTTAGQRPLSLGNASGKSLLLSSADTPWRGLPMELHAINARGGAMNPGEAGPADGERGALVVMEGSLDVVIDKQGQTIRNKALPGAVSLLSGERRPNVLQWSGTAKALAIEMPALWFERLGLSQPPAEMALDSGLRPDPQFFLLAQASLMEIEAGAPTGRLYAESLSTALLCHVLERLPMVAVKEHARGHLSEGQCRRLRGYVRERLGEDIRLAELAALIGISPRHFSLLFRRAFGMPPYRFVLSQRLAEGARRLAAGPVDLAQLSTDLGFCSQSHFSAAFRAEFRTTPRRYALQHRGIVVLEDDEPVSE
jgi:AraC-like DNA-binding protein